MDRLLAGIAALFLATVAGAADLAVLPVGFALGPGQDREAASITNRGSETVAIQAETVSWTQADGEDRYTPTTDLLVNPPLFSIPPGRTQVVRIGLRNPPDGLRETCYRLLLREVPSAAKAADAGGGQAGTVRVLLQLRLPVYVAPAVATRNAQWRAHRAGDGDIDVEMLNTGNVHLVVGQLALRAADSPEGGAPTALVKTSTSVFPGQRHDWRLHPEGTLPSRLRLDVTTDRDVLHVPVDLDGP